MGTFARNGLNHSRFMYGFVIRTSVDPAVVPPGNEANT